MESSDEFLELTPRLVKERRQGMELGTKASLHELQDVVGPTSLVDEFKASHQSLNASHFCWLRATQCHQAQHNNDILNQYA